MRFLRLDTSYLRLLACLAVAQVVGWGTLSLPAVAGSAMAGDLSLGLTVIFAGPSVLYVAMGLWAPMLVPVFTRHGARKVMIAGSTLAAPGLVLLALSQDLFSYFAAWVVLGSAGAATLSTAAYIFLNETLGQQAKSAIGALMLVTGLSSSVFWPLTAFLMQTIGWRGACLVFAAAMLLICVPIYSFGLGVRALHRAPAGAHAVQGGKAPVTRSTFYLVTTSITLNAFVTLGLSAVLIELLRARGLSMPQAVAFGSFLGVIQVAARGIDLLGGGRWDGVSTGIVAGSLLPIAMILLIVAGGTTPGIAGFILIYGLGSGALAVARATIPLAFYDKADYARAASRIALPLNLLSASAPPVMAGTLSHFGVDMVLALAILCSSLASVLLIVLRVRRPALAPAE
ncbi:MFS transporter [Bosea sp. 685]|uniref:MFS transporter n=1 Tax=Bosea sp. 685 TaxID=3080057 RepID=UPI0028930FCA|nr:MFS transporter [Bosea sp. 685]WNJ89336.1 MFS transporter [Bosea sp. 685]